MLTLQQIIARLSEFWEKQGCIIHQGHDLEVGAGTFNPATFLRCLGPEPYRTAYVEPSRRPQDGRYGENPFRIHLFHQYQVVIKPSPPDIKETYLQSIAALGYNLKEHDIRFVHSDWEGPTLGAWGLGWEVWLDGMEITQFTYFQAVGSLPLNPIAVEITYGLERLAMFIQNVDSIFDVRWNEESTLRELIHQSEIEWSRYNFDEASIAMWLRHFDDFEQEAKRLIALNLPLPAYDFVIKASHAFNILDARGSISVTERTGYVGRIRELSRLVAVAYLSEREKLGFPLLHKVEEKTSILPPFTPPRFDPQVRRDFLLEIGSEELPAAFISVGCTHLEKAIRHLLEVQGIPFESISVFGSPQRLSALVSNLAEGTSPKTLEKRGPSISAAFDADGKLTNQGEGFFRSANLKPSSLEEAQKGKVAGLTLKKEHLIASVSEEGKSTMALLAAHLPKLILDLDFPKKMRWGSLDISYARPLRWIAALFGDALIPFSVGDINSDRFSYGHAQLSPKKFPLKTASDYISDLKHHNVLVDRKEREESIVAQLKVLEKEMRGSILEQNRVLKEVVNLVEWPLLTYATFDQRFLKAPSEVLISEMVEHQKYFPVANSKGDLSHFFVITADTTPSDPIRHGNEKVLSARLADGVFLYETDLKIPLENFNVKLEQMTFQKSLGNMLDKVMRLATLTDLLNQQLKIADQKQMRRASLLCKADLASSLVGEFPELQGTAGKYYALAQKEEREVAEAIEEHWMPRYENAPLPKSSVGILLSLADKFDNLLGYFSVGLKPTSSGDPYALRRQTLGILHILIKNTLSLDLKQFLTRCAEAIPLFKAEVIEEILLFLTARSKTVFENYEMKKEEIEAALRGLCNDPFDQFCRIKALHTFRHSSAEFAKLLEVYKRAKGQLTEPSEKPFDPSLAQEAAEIELFRALTHMENRWKETLNDKNYAKAFELIAALQPHLAHLFDTVKILADDPSLRANRIALLQRVFAPFEDLVDFSKLS